MPNDLYEVHIRDLHKHFHSVINDELSEDIFIAELRYEESLRFINHPCRFDGFLAFFCLSGHFSLEMNLRRFEVESGSLFIYTPGNIVRAEATDGGPVGRDLHFVVVAISESMMTSTRFDFSKLYDESIRVLENPCVSLGEKERQMCRRYIELGTDIASLNTHNVKDAIASLISSLFYLMGMLWNEKLTSAKESGEAKSVRSRVIFEDFLDLVKAHHRKEHGLGFYADRLYITPKYLSKLVKNVSGKSAHEWIDSFVILEAKNLLKYSDLSIKDVVYELNFPNQSTFYRFFKAHTGMTPTEYRKV